MTGGELVAAAGERFGGFFGVTRSQVYRELPALAEAGLLRLGKRGARASQQYVITAVGKRAFKNWLSTVPGPDQPRSPLVLRLVHAGSLSGKQRSDLLEQAKSVSAERLEAARTAAKATADAHAKAAAEFSVAHARALVKLVDSIAAL
jgi:DNA-binding PadR family transcriptional regulator